MLIVIEGIDGSGKSVVVGASRAFFERHGLRVLDLRGKTGYPEEKLLLHYDAVLCGEPTHTTLGRDVRALVQAEGDVLRMARAFSADRKQLFERVVIPLRGKLVVEERSFLSSVVYQAVPREKLLALPGNALAVRYPPALVLLADCPVRLALERLALREKKDRAVFEKAGPLQKARDRYLGEDFSGLVGRLGAQLIKIDTSGSIAETDEQCVRALSSVFKDTRRTAPGGF